MHGRNFFIVQIAQVKVISNKHFMCLFFKEIIMIFNDELSLSNYYTYFMCMICFY